MKKYLKLILMAACMIGSFSLASCDDDDTTVNQIYYISTEPAATSFPTVCAYSLVDKVISDGRTSFYIVGKSTMRADRDVKLDIEQTSGLVEEYNQANNKKYLALPEEAYSFSANNVTIKSGENFSSDTIFISLKNIDKLSPTDQYLLPVSLKSTSDNGMISSNERVIYFIIYLDPSPVGNNKPISWKALDRSNWEVDCSYVYGNNDPLFAIDDNISTTWFAYGVINADECWWSTVLDAPVKLVGFSITRQSAFGASYNVKQATVKVKANGETEWTDYSGTFKFNTFNGSDAQYAIFSPAIENVKEFRIDIALPNSFTGFAELNLYKE